jgi:N-acetylmuramoyl-L-alanine amidase
MGFIHVVRPGECLSTIARRHGFASWRAVYECPENQDFRRQRPNPNLIWPGDQVFIPDPSRRQELADTAQRHRFRTRRSAPRLRLVLKDPQDQPLGSVRFRALAGERVSEGETDAQGALDIPVAADVPCVDLTLWPYPSRPETSIVLKLGLGTLAPLETTEGVQARLNNLLFDAGDVDGIHGRITTAALKGFQDHCGLDVNGIAGPETAGELRKRYGC